MNDVVNDPVLGDAARLLFPAEGWYWSGDTLGSLSYTWYTGRQLLPRGYVQLVGEVRAREGDA